MNVFYIPKSGFATPFFLLFLFFQLSLNAQVGIGTTTPQGSSILDINSDSKGLLIPRMSTRDRLRITNPATSLLVYDTNEKAFFFNEASPSSPGWIKISSDFPKRDDYKLVKNISDLAPEFAAGGGLRYLLTEGTFYEINGSITLQAPIDLNNAYLSGLDTNEDKLIRSAGPVFTGNKGGSIRNLTITGGGSVFAITGGNSLIVQNAIIANMGSVGSISDVGMYFGNIIQYVGNSNGIKYNNISNLLLSNQGWFESNSGTYETFSGTFNLIEKVSGFSIANGGSVAMDFRLNPMVSNGVILGVVFSGTNNQPVRGYNPQPYDGYNFTNKWTVDSPGIPHESDGVATGDINLSAAINSGESTIFLGSGPNSRRKLAGQTSSINLLRFKREGNNKIIYEGEKKRFFQITTSVSYQASDSGSPVFIFYVAKNGVAVLDSKVYGKAPNGFFPSGILAVPIVATVELENGDYIEVFAEKYSGSGNLQTVALNLTIR